HSVLLFWIFVVIHVALGELSVHSLVVFVAILLFFVVSRVSVTHLSVSLLLFFVVVIFSFFVTQLSVTTLSVLMFCVVLIFLFFGGSQVVNRAVPLSLFFVVARQRGLRTQWGFGGEYGRREGEKPQSPPRLASLVFWDLVPFLPTVGVTAEIPTTASSATAPSSTSSAAPAAALAKSLCETRKWHYATVMFAKPLCETQKWHFATVMFAK
ncbi:membrane-associated protein, putative, partial [Bodo saltans]